MLEPVDIMDVADSDFLNEDEFFEDENDSDSEIEKYYVISTSRNRLFGCKKPLHVVLGSGNLADVMLWRNKYISLPTPTYSKLNSRNLSYPERLLVRTALSMRKDCNQALRTFWDITQGNDLKKFLMVTLTLWLISVVGSWFTIVTLSYIVCVILLTVPVLYERHEDRVDTFAEMAMVELMKQYAELNKMVCQKHPISISCKDSKRQ
ncbi:Reticulon-like protein [Quillaja saponaria]|uniref:Reticulon-like protein n=1 Tax=Quillaja saponaria TaxID=32244 RepID=A0AAD7PRG0_QUISA|nr:Reticulon-like protein [Quillaja saponaria]